MSGFFGIFRPQGGPVDLEAFEQMKTAMHRDGFDGMETHVEEKVAMGHLMLRVSPESKYDKQPLKSSCGNYILVGHFRLDYRDELGDKLGLTQSELEVTPDSQLAMLAYQKWKEKCVHHLEGDWAFAIFSVYGNSLGLFRDQFGYSALFYFCNSQHVYFSSDISLFSNISFMDLKLDMEQVLRISTNTFSLSKKKTLFQDLFNLEHGTHLNVSDSMHFLTVKYWELVNYPNILYKNKLEYSDQLFSLYQRSVLTKFDSKLQSAIFLSSGLDSTSVCYFLDKMAEYNKAKILSFTSIPLYLNEFTKTQLKFSDEKPYVQEFVGRAKTIIPHFYNFNNRETDFLEFACRDFFFPIATPTSFWVDGIYEEAKRLGAKRVYNGQFGNITVSNVNSGYMLNYLFKLKWRNLFAELKMYSSKGGIGFFHGIKEYIYRPILKLIVAWLNQRINIEKLFNDSVFKLEVFEKYMLIPKLKIEFSKTTNPFVINELSTRKQLFEGVADIATVNWYNYSLHHGIETIDPTCDLRLMRYSTSIPPEIFNQNGLPSYLFKTTFRNYLPDSLLNLKFRRLQSMDIAFRLRQSDKFTSKFKTLFSDSTLVDSFVKKDSLNNDFNVVHSSTDLFHGYISSRKLMKSISLVNFFKKIALNQNI